MTDIDLANTGPSTTGGDTEIDLYADVVENELETETGDDYGTNSEHIQRISNEGDLYDDVITTQPSGTDFADITNTVHHNHAKLDHSGNHMNSMNNSGGKRVSLYVGQLTWWTTDVDLTEAIHDIDIPDLLEVKFHENRVNGQSKGFAVVTVGSEASSRSILEKLPKREIYGQIPHVLPCNKQSLSFFEGATRKDEPMPPMAAAPLHQMMRPPLGLQIPMPRPGPMDQSYRFPQQGTAIISGGPGMMGRPPMQGVYGPRGPVPGAPMMINRMPGGPSQQPVVVMQQGQRPGVPPGAGGPPLVRQPIRPGAPGMPPGVHPTGYYPAQGAPPPAPGQPHSDPYYRSPDGSNTLAPISEAEFQDIMERNKSVSSSAIGRAVQDASIGDFATAIETLVTAISLIRQSKIANDDRCKILISSLQDTLKGIEDKSYGQRSRHRSRSGSPRESRKKHRHRSRSPRDRNEYRRGEDYDSKYSREHRRR